MFDINQYQFDKERGYLDIAGEAMIFHCHHYINYLLRSIMDAEYIDSKPFIIGASADAVHNQLSQLCDGLSPEDAKRMAESTYKAFGYGLIDLSEMTEKGITLSTVKSFFSKTWLLKFGQSKQHVDFYTTGFIAAAYSVIYNIPLAEVNASQTSCMACGDVENTHVIKRGHGNFSTYPKKHPVQFNDVTREAIAWPHEEIITQAFLGAHANFIGNEEGFIPAFGVFIVRNQSDYVNRLQFEFMRAMKEVAGDYGETLASELLLEAGQACGFFTYGGIMNSKEWNTIVKPYLKTKEDWIMGLVALINTMGWGYHTVIELSKERAVFRNYNDFEDLSYQRMYASHSPYPVHWANSGGFTGLMQLIYETDLVYGNPIETEEGFRQMRRAKLGYKTNMRKGMTCGDDYLEVEVYL